jgi:hypothetical protein
MTYMRSWKNLRLTSHTWLGLNPQIGRPLSRIVVPLVYLFFFISKKYFEMSFQTFQTIFTLKNNNNLVINYQALRKKVLLYYYGERLKRNEFSYFACTQTVQNIIRRKTIIK